MGRPPGDPPGDEAHEGATRILGVIRVLSESRRVGSAEWTRKRLLSGDEGPANHQGGGPESTETAHNESWIATLTASTASTSSISKQVIAFKSLRTSKRL